ncbi:unnamed protein product [Colias eurytheme]|nr:unnamed protein product [Colias eurytheme]
MFRFPINDKSRLKLWLDNAGNMNLSHLTEDELYNRYICEVHFQHCDIKKTTAFRPVLEKTAVPKCAISPEHLKVKTPVKKYSNKRKLDFGEGNITDPEYNFRKKLIDIDNFEFKSENAKIFTKMQLRKQQTKWKTSEKNFCLSLYYKSPSMYRHLIKMGLILASPSTIKRWLQRNSCFPGVSKTCFENVKKKFEHASIKEKACVVCFDEMSIMTCLEFNEKHDQIEGFEDYGKGHRTDKKAKSVLVFVARGLYVKWKIPLAYFLAHTNVKTEHLKNIIKSVLQKCMESGLLPKAIVCDQGTTNVSALKGMGVNADTPYFYIQGSKIFSIFDVPHIMKNLRNNLLTNNFIWDGKEVSFKDVVNLYNIDKNNKSKSIKKITPSHLNPNSFEKMKVKLATQVFSQSVSAAMETAVATGDLKSETAVHTAKFLKEINNLFDSLNSKSLKHKNPYKRALTKKNDAVRKTLKNGLKIMNDLKKINYTKDGQKKYTVPLCFTGMVQTITSVLCLFDEEFKNGIQFIHTYRLNQDIIENLFGLYRTKTGSNRNPTAKQLRAVFRNNFLNGLTSMDTGNCEGDDEKFITIDDENEPPVQDDQIPSTITSTPSTSITNLEPAPSTSTMTALSEPEEITCSNKLEECSISYFAGYLGKKCFEKYRKTINNKNS